jgi:2-octaprenyl-6-methoxyphenol hydroxylase
MARRRFDIGIAGGGAVGLAAGIALARAGWSVVLAGPAGARRDGRTIALMDGSLRFLDTLGLLPRIEAESAPLETMTIVDDTGALLRAPPVSFHARELGLDAFGRNVETAPLVWMIAGAARATPGLTLAPELVSATSTDPAGATMTLAGGETLEVDVVVGADGRDSSVRERAGIASRSWSYPQSAITAIFAHDRPHRETSTEFHTRFGPFTLVPLPGLRSSLVWLTKPRHAERLMQLWDGDFAMAAEKQARSLLGAMRLDGPRGCVPMAGLSVDRFTAERVALVGEAAHVFPPIGAQGLNLGLRDVAALVKAVGSAGGDAGAPEKLRRYETARGADVRTRTLVVDTVNRSLLADFAPVDAARSLGLMAVAAIPPLRRMVMRQGLGPSV